MSFIVIFSYMSITYLAHIHPYSPRPSLGEDLLFCHITLSLGIVLWYRYFFDDWALHSILFLYLGQLCVSALIAINCKVSRRRPFLARPTIIVVHRVHSWLWSTMTSLILYLAQHLPALWKLANEYEASKSVKTWYLRVLWLEYVVSSAMGS